MHLIHHKYQWFHGYAARVFNSYFYFPIFVGQVLLFSEPAKTHEAHQPPDACKWAGVIISEFSTFSGRRCVPIKKKKNYSAPLSPAIFWSLNPRCIEMHIWSSHETYDASQMAGASLPVSFKHRFTAVLRSTMKQLKPFSSNFESFYFSLCSVRLSQYITSSKRDKRTAKISIPVCGESARSEGCNNFNSANKCIGWLPNKAMSLPSFAGLLVPLQNDWHFPFPNSSRKPSGNSPHERIILITPSNWSTSHNPRLLKRNPRGSLLEGANGLQWPLPSFAFRRKLLLLARCCWIEQHQPEFWTVFWGRITFKIFKFFCKKSVRKHADEEIKTVSLKKVSELS